MLHSFTYQRGNRFCTNYCDFMYFYNIKFSVIPNTCRDELVDLAEAGDVFGYTIRMFVKACMFKTFCF